MELGTAGRFRNLGGLSGLVLESEISHIVRWRTERDPRADTSHHKNGEVMFDGNCCTTRVNMLMALIYGSVVNQLHQKGLVAEAD